MTDETFEKIRDFAKRNYVHDPFGYLGKLAEIPVVVDPDAPDDEPILSEIPDRVEVRVSRSDFNDLRRRSLVLEEEARTAREDHPLRSALEESAGG